MYYRVISECLLFFSALLVLLLWPISYVHTRRMRATLADYAAYRRKHGAPADDWPNRSREHDLFASPYVILTGAVLATMLVLFGALMEFLRPDPFHTMPGYSPAPFDPLLIVAILGGAVAAITLGLWAWRRFQAPWFAVGDLMRRAIYAPLDVRERLFAAALLVDPEMTVLREESAADDTPSA